ncbi:MAG: hypothetical protein PHE83_01220 [Opitutaceae bacterium]|nr:hypothetical protein [Opitutaceae bacterium]
MKTITTLLFLAAALTGFGQPPVPGAQPPVNVYVATEVEELARGYALAFPSISTTPVYLTLRKEGAVVTLVSVKSVKAAAGVLIVELDQGPIYILNPQDILSITNAPPAKGP